MANEETGFGTIKCPGCGEAIPISEAIHHQIAERTRQEFKAEALSRKEGHVGAVAFSRTGDPATGDFSDAIVIRKFGDVPDDLSAL